MFKTFSSSGLTAFDEAFESRLPVLDGLESVCFRFVVPHCASACDWSADDVAEIESL